MIISIKDISDSGWHLEFELDTSSINKRVNFDTRSSILDYFFKIPPKANLNINLQGETVFINGEVISSFISPCSRCLKEIETKLLTKITLTLKPKKNSNSKKHQNEEIEDLNLSYYTGVEINLGEIVEEELILNLPQVLTCKKESLKECKKRSEEMKSYFTSKNKDEIADERLAILKTLKVD